MAFLSPRHPCRGARVAGCRRIGRRPDRRRNPLWNRRSRVRGHGPVLLPDDQSFCALVADPKEPSTFISYLRGRFRTLDDPSGVVTNIATIGVGDTFGLIRFGGPAAGEGFQLDAHRRHLRAVRRRYTVDRSHQHRLHHRCAAHLSPERLQFTDEAGHQSSHLGDE